MELFNRVNLKEFQTLRYIVDNTREHHLTCIIKIMIQSDKIDTPYYMDTEIAITHCSEIENKGIIHAMDVLRHHRMYNITEEKYNLMKKTIYDSFRDVEDKSITINFTQSKDEIEIRTLNKSKLQKILTRYADLFGLIDDLV